MKMKKRGTLVVLHRNAAFLMDGNLDTIILLDVVYQLVHLGKCQCHYCIVRISDADRVSFPGR